MKLNKILVLVGHPDLASSCNSKSFVNAVKDFENVKVHDFDPEDLDIEYEHRLLEDADIILAISPMMWFSCSAKLKKYIEEVFTPGWAYSVSDDGSGSLKGKTFSIILTTAASGEVITASDMTAYTAQFSSIANFCGMNYINAPSFHGVYFPTQQQISDNLNIFLEFISTIQ